MRQNYFCFLLQYHTANVEKRLATRILFIVPPFRVILSPPKDCPEVLDGSLDPESRVEVFLNALVSMVCHSNTTHLE